jgi:hypothetical protein
MPFYSLMSHMTFLILRQEMYKLTLFRHSDAWRGLVELLHSYILHTMSNSLMKTSLLYVIFITKACGYDDEQSPSKFMVLLLTPTLVSAPLPEVY